MKIKWSGWEIEENCHALVNQFHGNIHSEHPRCRKITPIFRDVQWCFNASWGLKGLKKSSVSVGVQCTRLTDQLEVQLKDRSRICRLCGKENFQDDDDDVAAADRWYGCETSGCDYWVHSQCIGFTFHLAAATIEKKNTFSLPFSFWKKTYAVRVALIIFCAIIIKHRVLLFIKFEVPHQVCQDNDNYEAIASQRAHLGAPTFLHAYSSLHLTHYADASIGF